MRRHKKGSISEETDEFLAGHDILAVCEEHAILPQ